MLSGLKEYPINISAIVSMADDGGSTGVLRDELGVFPPGDVRQCLVALSDSSKSFHELMNYRFESGRIKGCSFGNLFLSALEKLNGGFSRGVEEAAKILNVKGEVIPVTVEDTNLYMRLKNGKILKGEEKINHNYDLEKIGIRKNYLKPSVKANRKAVKAILEADMVVIGPGNHYCSIIPNLLVKGIPEALQKTKARVVYNCNLVNKPGHTEKFSLDDYVLSINKHIGRDRIDFVTYNNKKPGRELMKRYKNKKELPIEFQNERNRKRNYRIVQADMLSDAKPKYSRSDVLAQVRSFIRHNPRKLAKILMTILELD